MPDPFINSDPSQQAGAQLPAGVSFADDEEQSPYWKFSQAFQKQFGRPLEVTGDMVNNSMHRTPAKQDAFDVRTKGLKPEHLSWMDNNLNTFGLKATKSNGTESWSSGPHWHLQPTEQQEIAGQQAQPMGVLPEGVSFADEESDSTTSAQIDELQKSLGGQRLSQQSPEEDQPIALKSIPAEQVQEQTPISFSTTYDAQGNPTGISSVPIPRTPPAGTFTPSEHDIAGADAFKSELYHADLSDLVDIGANGKAKLKTGVSEQQFLQGLYGSATSAAGFTPEAAQRFMQERGQSPIGRFFQGVDPRNTSLGIQKILEGIKQGPTGRPSFDFVIPPAIKGQFAQYTAPIEREQKENLARDIAAERATTVDRAARQLLRAAGVVPPPGDAGILPEEAGRNIGQFGEELTKGVSLGYLDPTLAGQGEGKKYTSTGAEAGRILGGIAPLAVGGALAGPMGVALTAAAQPMIERQPGRSYNPEERLKSALVNELSLIPMGASGGLAGIAGEVGVKAAIMRAIAGGAGFAAAQPMLHGRMPEAGDWRQFTAGAILSLTHSIAAAKGRERPELEDLQEARARLQLPPAPPEVVTEFMRGKATTKQHVGPFTAGLGGQVTQQPDAPYTRPNIDVVGDVPETRLPADLQVQSGAQSEAVTPEPIKAARIIRHRDTGLPLLVVGEEGNGWIVKNPRTGNTYPISKALTEEPAGRVYMKGSGEPLDVRGQTPEGKLQVWRENGQMEDVDPAWTSIQKPEWRRDIPTPYSTQEKAEAAAKRFTDSHPDTTTDIQPAVSGKGYHWFWKEGKTEVPKTEVILSEEDETKTLSTPVQYPGETGQAIGTPVQYPGIEESGKGVVGKLPEGVEFADERHALPPAGRPVTELETEAQEEINRKQQEFQPREVSPELEAARKAALSKLLAKQENVNAQQAATSSTTTSPERVPQAMVQEPTRGAVENVIPRDVTPQEAGEALRRKYGRESTGIVYDRRTGKPLEVLADAPPQGLHVRNPETGKDYAIHRNAVDDVNAEQMPDIHREMEQAGLDARQRHEAFKQMGIEFKDPVQMTGTVRGVDAATGKQLSAVLKYRVGKFDRNYTVVGRFPGGEKLMVVTPEAETKIIQSPFGETGNTRVRGGADRLMLGKVPEIDWPDVGLLSDVHPTAADVRRVNPNARTLSDLSDVELQKYFPQTWKNIQDAEGYIGDKAAREAVSQGSAEILPEEQKGSTEEPETVRKSRERLRQNLSGNTLSMNPVQSFYDTAVTVGWDVYKAAKSGAANFEDWSKDMIKRLGDNVKPHLESAWDALTKPAPIWFSPLERQIKLKMSNKMPALELRKMLDKTGLSRDELEWTNTNEFLKQKANAGELVTKKEMLEHLAKPENQIQIKDVWHGGESNVKWEDLNPKTMETIQRGDWEGLQHGQTAIRKATSPDGRTLYVVPTTSGTVAPYIITDQLPLTKLPEGHELRKTGSGLDEYWSLVKTSPDGRYDNTKARFPAVDERSALNKALTVLDGEHEIGTARSIEQATGIAERRLGAQKEVRYAQYATPGGKNQRELLLTLPEPSDNFMTFEQFLRSDYGEHPSEAEFTEAQGRYDRQKDKLRTDNAIGRSYHSPHWDEPNVLAHVRMNDRDIPIESIREQYPELYERLKSEGRDTARGLHVEEVQSDWMQSGRKKGFKVDPESVELVAKKNNGFYEIRTKDGEFVTNVMEDWGERGSTQGTYTPEEAIAETRKRLQGPQSEVSLSPAIRDRVPNAPLSKTWQDASFKRMLREASEKGYDLMTWSTGAEQFKRWGSQRVDWMKGGVSVGLKGGEWPIDNAKIRELEDRFDLLKQKVDSSSVRPGDRVATVGAGPSRGGYSYSTGKIYEAYVNKDGNLAWKKADEFGGIRAGRSNKFIHELQAEAEEKGLEWSNEAGHGALVKDVDQSLFVDLLRTEKELRLSRGIRGVKTWYPSTEEALQAIKGQGGETSDFKVKPYSGWRVNTSEQSGGQAGGVDIEQEAIRQNVLKSGTATVSTSNALRKIIEKTMNREKDEYSPENWKKHIDAMTDKVWGRMQVEDVGTHMPRKEGLEKEYDRDMRSFAEKYGKKFGAKVGEVPLWTLKSTPEEIGRLATSMGPEYGVKPEDNVSVHAIDVSPKMRDSVIRAGQSLFGSQEGEPSAATDSLVRLQEQMAQKKRNPPREAISAINPKAQSLVDLKPEELKANFPEVAEQVGRAKQALGGKAGTEAIRHASTEILPEESDQESERVRNSRLWLQDRANGGTLGAGQEIIPAMYHTAIVTGSDVMKAGKYVYGKADDFAAWSKDMVGRLGDRAKPFLEEVWNRLNEQAPQWFSPLENTIKLKMPNKASADQVKGILRGGGFILKGENGIEIPNDEAHWTGLYDFLQRKSSAKEQVTKQEVLDHLRVNGIQLTERQFGENLEYDAALRRLSIAGYDIKVNPEKPTQVVFTEVASDDRDFLSAAELPEHLRKDAELVDDQHWRGGGDIDQWTEDRQALVARQNEVARTLNNAYVRDRVNSLPRELLEGTAIPSDYGEYRGLAQEMLDLQQEIARHDRAKPSGTPPKFTAHVTPGGANQREFTLSLPFPQRSDIKGITDEINVIAKKARDEQRDLTNDESSHIEMLGVRLGDIQRGGGKNYTPPGGHLYGISEADINRIAIIRTNDRVGPNGEKILHVDEYQDDLQNQIQQIKATLATGDGLPGEDTMLRGKLKELESLLPFRGKSHELAMKRVLDYAVKNGYDKVSWATGQQVADRYDLRKYFDQIGYYVKSIGSYNLSGIERGGSTAQLLADYVPAVELEEYVGKDLAQKILAGEGEKDGDFRIFKNTDLGVGGSGKLTLYDNLIPNFLSKYTKRWGGKVGETSFEIPPKDETAGGGRIAVSAGFWRPPEKVSVHSLDITPEMRNAINKTGQPLFGSSEGEPPMVIDARARLAESMSGKRMNVNPIRDLTDLALITGYDTYKLAKKFNGWSNQMVKKLGDSVKPHLESVWAKVKAFHENERGFIGEGNSSGRTDKGTTDWDDIDQAIPPGSERRDAGAKGTGWRSDMGPQNYEEGPDGPEPVSALPPRTIKQLWNGMTPIQRMAEGANIPRTLVATGNFHAVFKHGAILGYSHPIDGLATPMKDMLRAFWSSPDKFKELQQEMMMHPRFQQSRDAGVEYTGMQMGRPEEEYMSRMLTQKIPTIKRFEQAFSTFLNSQRLNVYSDYADALDGMGADFDKEPNPYYGAARFINAASGRGDLGQISEATKELMNGSLFSPRYMKSRWDILGLPTLTDTGGSRAKSMYQKMDPMARKLALTDMFKYVGVVGTTMSLAALAGAKVTMSPEDPDFGKIVVGNTHYDITGGTGQYLRLMVRLAGDFYRMDPKAAAAAVIGRPDKGVLSSGFIRNHLAPTPSALVSMYYGKDFKGDPVTAGSMLKELITPMFLHDTYEGWKDSGLVGAVKTVPAFFGASSQTYPVRAAQTPKGPMEQSLLNRVKAQHGDAVLPEDTKERLAAEKDVAAAVKAGDWQGAQTKYEKYVKDSVIPPGKEGGEGDKSTVNRIKDRAELTPLQYLVKHNQSIDLEAALNAFLDGKATDSERREIAPIILQKEEAFEKSVNEGKVVKGKIDRVKAKAEQARKLGIWDMSMKKAS